MRLNIEQVTRPQNMKQTWINRKGLSLKLDQTRIRVNCKFTENGESGNVDFSSFHDLMSKRKTSLSVDLINTINRLFLFIFIFELIDWVKNRKYCDFQDGSLFICILISFICIFQSNGAKLKIDENVV